MAVIREVAADGVAYLTLDRSEKHHALSPHMLVEIANAWAEWATDDSVRAVILTATGEKSFCTGGDLGLLIPLLTGARTPSDPIEASLLSDLGIRDRALLRSYFPKPVIAAINGMCVAGGMEMMLGTDIRIAAEHAVFSLPEASRAIIPAAGSLARLPRQIPYCRAMEILLTGARFTADEALRMGLINYVVPAADLRSKAEEMARSITMNGPLAVREIKRVVTGTSGLTIDQAFAAEDAAWARVAASEDAKEGPRAFVEKRAPVYIGA